MERERRFHPGMKGMSMSAVRRLGGVVLVVLVAPVVRADPVQDVYDQGVKALTAGDYDRAIARFTEVLRLDPKSGAAHYSRGLAYSKKGELDRALDDLNEAVKLDPKRATGYLGR